MSNRRAIQNFVAIGCAHWAANDALCVDINEIFNAYHIVVNNGALHSVELRIRNY